MGTPNGASLAQRNLYQQMNRNCRLEVSTSGVVIGTFLEDTSILVSNPTKCCYEVQSFLVDPCRFERMPEWIRQLWILREQYLF